MPTLVPLANNLIRNGAFAHRESEWSATGEVDFSQQICMLKGIGQAEQSVTVLQTTDYTFSLYSLIVSNGAGEAHVEFQPTGTRESIPLSGNHGWLRQVLTFTTPTGTTSAIVRLQGTSGEVWFDNTRLVEESGPVIPTELIRNGDFAANNRDWNAVRPTLPSNVEFTDERCQLTLGGYMEQAITVTPGQAYDFSIDARGITGGHGFVRFLLAPGEAPEVELRGDGWDTYTYSLTPPAGVTSFTLQIEGTTFLEVDNVSLQLAP